MRIERIELRRLALPLRQPFETSFGRCVQKEFLLASVSADGVTGLGECVADVDPFYLPETLGTVLHILESFLVPAALAADISHPKDLCLAFQKVRGHEMARATLEMAAYDLWARRLGLPLYAVLGGRRGTIAAGVSVGLQESVPALVASVEREVAAGYRRVKIKIKPGQDVELVAAVRARFPDLPLMADANSAYTPADLPVLKALDNFGLMMIEQPLAYDDLVDHAALQAELRTPLCLDESIRSAADARRALSLGACRIVNLKPGRVGGFTESLALHDECVRRGAPLWCGGMLESGIGRLANVHLQTLPGFTLPGDTSASARYFAEDLVEPAVAVSAEGQIEVPEGPGLGRAIRHDRIDAATRAEWAWS